MKIYMCRVGGYNVLQNNNSSLIKNYNNDNNLYIKNSSYPNINFGANYQHGITKLQKLEIAENALVQLTQHLKSGEPLDAVDGLWLSKLQKLFGAKTMTVNDPNNPGKLLEIDCELTLEKVKNGGVIPLINALKTMIAASKYKPTKVKLDNIEYTVHNKAIANLLHSEYDEKHLKDLINYLNKNHVFDMSDNTSYGLVIDSQRGIVKTCGASENWEMSDRAWVTDIMRVGDIQKEKRPETWTKVLNTIGDYYKTQSSNFKTLINDPVLYREGSPLEGIPHIFMPKTLKPDLNWFNNKRLESHGLALKELSAGIIDGLAKAKKHGYQTAAEIPQNTIEAMDNLSKFFHAIDYSTAPSAGNWEEIPLKGGLTSDTEAIRSALNAYKDLLYNPKYNNSEIKNIRARIQDLNPLDEKTLEDMIIQGRNRVRRTYLEEAPNIRPHDSSLVFITTSDIKLADNVHEDVKKHVEILESLEHNLVRENGMIRYAPFNYILNDGTKAKSPDSYLNLNYFNAIDKNGKLNLDWKKILDMFASKDCSEPKMFFARAKLSTPNKEAQWFMVSEMSTGYGKQIEKLVKNGKKHGLTEEDILLIANLKKKQTEYLNRALARISEENPNLVNQIKANGLPMPRVTVSEAHQYVTDINGKPKMMQGTNAPLAWAVSSLYKALKQQYITLQLLT